MTPTSFEFTLTLPSDSRLVGAVRGLISHAAGYAQLSDAARESLAGQVVAATETAMASAAGTGVPIAIQFTGDDTTLAVVISFEAGATPPRAPSASAGDAAVEWTSEDSRHVCRIRQRIDG